MILQPKTVYKTRAGTKARIARESYAFSFYGAEPSGTFYGIYWTVEGESICSYWYPKGVRYPLGPGATSDEYDLVEVWSESDVPPPIPTPREHQVRERYQI